MMVSSTSKKMFMRIAQRYHRWGRQYHEAFEMVTGRFALMRGAWLACCALAGASLIWTGVGFADPLTTWTAGPDSVLDDTYTGAIDLPVTNASVPAGGFGLSGWVVDQTADGWSGVDDVQIWLGVMGSG